MQDQGQRKLQKGWMELLARLQTLNAIEIAIDQQVAAGEKTSAEGARQKAQVKRKQKQDVTRDFKKGQFVVEPIGLTKVETNVLNAKGKPKKEFDLTTSQGRALVNTIDDFIKLNPEFGYLFEKGMTGGFGLTFRNVNRFRKSISAKYKKGPLGRIKYSKTGSILNEKAINRFIDDPGLIQKRLDLLKDLFLSIQSYIKKNPDSASAFQRFLRDATVDQNHPLRFLAPTVFYPIKPNNR